MVEDAALRIPEVRSVWTLIGAQLQADEGGAVTTRRAHLAQAIIELIPVDQRERTSEDIIAQLRRETADTRSRSSR